jgi:hypothetical protein
MMYASGIIYGTRRHPVTGSIKRDVSVGTGFCVLIESEDGYLHAYLVTADHVVPNDRYELHVTSYASNADIPPIPLTDWCRPFPGVDLAICTLPIWTSTVGLVTLYAERQLYPSHVRAPSLGQVVTYVGLLGPLDVPMARTGTLGNVNQPIPRTNKYPYAYNGHLVDCRSYNGFSGSPVYLETTVVQAKQQKLHPALTAGEVELSEMMVSSPVHLNHWFGMLTAHLDDPYFDEYAKGGPVEVASRHGVGIVLPAETILAGLKCEELAMARKRKDDEAERTKDEPPIAGASRRPKRDMDARTSLYPLTPEQAVKGLLDTPPAADDTDEG